MKILNTQDMIKILEYLKSDLHEKWFKSEIDWFENIIQLLQRGEKFEQMWGELEKEYGNVHHFYSIQNERFCTGNEVTSYLSETMNYIKQKHFPEVRNMTPIHHG